MNRNTLARTTQALAVVTCLALASHPVCAAVRPTIEDGPALPPIWQKVDARERILLVRAAELDATRLLVERIQGVSINGESSVKDLAAADDKVAAEVQSFIQGVKTVGEPSFTEDGRVEVVRKVHVNQLIRRIQETYRSSTEGPETKESNTTTEEREVIFDIMGSSAIKGSEGYKRILAKRAAEVDAARRLAERMTGVQVTSKTTLGALAVEHDEIKSHMAGLLKNAETVNIRFLPDQSVQVTLRVVWDPKVRVITRLIRDGESSILSDKTEVLQFEETGSGVAPVDPPEGAGASEAPSETTASYQTDVTMETVVEQAVTGKGDPP